jgi:hypothetical protein
VIRVSVEVGCGTAHFSVAVRAENIRQAVGIVEARYPGGVVRVVHPIDPESFFIREPAAAGPVELEMPESVAG